ncbi:MAG: sulfur reduction protein DsrE [Elusimicrobia bacterium GWA2_69_24]|nr:MAG: sulfur reduction protein DsrE [Elusimicrobia bacterium GWA2_69_24]HBL17141.1 sulfur reduction protein DsrE [Elusimicrobiota bacterium]
MKLGVVISVAEAETAWNALRLANFAKKQGDEVAVFFMGPGVDSVETKDQRFDVKAQAEDFRRAGGKLLACGTCLKLRERDGSEVCPLSTMKDLYELVRDSDRVVTF